MVLSIVKRILLSPKGHQPGILEAIASLLHLDVKEGIVFAIDMLCPVEGEGIFIILYYYNEILEVGYFIKKSFIIPQFWRFRAQYSIDLALMKASGRMAL